MAITDEMLLKYVDGDLSDDERRELERLLEGDDLAGERVALMRASGSYLEDASKQTSAETSEDPLAASILDGTFGQKPLPIVEPKRYSVRQVPAWAACVLIMCIGLSFVGGMAFDSHRNASQLPEWAERVADYQTLYMRQTVENAKMSEEERTAFVAKASGIMGTDVSIPDLSGHDLEFRRAQLLSFRGNTVVQLVYLPKGVGEPVALCFMKQAKADKVAALNSHRNLNVVSWTKDNLGFLLVAEMGGKKLLSVARDSGA